MINSPEAEAKAEAAVDSHLASRPADPRSQLAALHELYAAYLELNLDSAAALAIKADLERRIVDVSVKHPSAVATQRIG